MRSILKTLLLFTGFFSPALLYAVEPVILIIGDSLSAGYGMTLDASWPRLLQQRLDDNGHSYRVFNSSISGDTTQGGLARFPRLLGKHQPDIVIIELGANDGLRGIDVDVTRKNFIQMIESSLSIGATVMLAGMRLPPNYGQTYTEKFHMLYVELAEQYGLLLVPFLMEGVALDPQLLQDDGIHPNAQAQPALLDNVWRVLEPALD